MSDVLVRKAGTDDRQLIERFMAGLQAHECMLEDNRAAPEDSTIAHVDYLLDDMARNSGCAFIAEIDGQPVGFIACSIDADNGAYVKPAQRRFGYINDIFVDETARGTGIANLLVEAAEAHCRAQGVDQMRLYALANNKLARAYYEKSGWSTYEVSYRKPL